MFGNSGIFFFQNFQSVVGWLLGCGTLESMDMEGRLYLKDRSEATAIL